MFLSVLRLNTICFMRKNVVIRTKNQCGSYVKPNCAERLFQLFQALEHFVPAQETFRFQYGNDLFLPMGCSATSGRRFPNDELDTTLFIDEANLQRIVVVLRSLIAKLGENLVYRLLFLWCQSLLATVYSVVRGTATHGIHHSILDGLGITMLHIVVKLTQSPCRLVLAHSHEVLARSVEAGIGVDGTTDRHIIGLELGGNEADALLRAWALLIKTILPAVVVVNEAVHKISVC